MPPVPVAISTRLTRGQTRADRERGARRLCEEFVRGEQYSWVSEGGEFFNNKGQGSVASAGGAANRHRVRQTRNLIKPLVDEKVSAATQRVPSYEVTPSTSDPDDLSAASLSEKIALAGYSLWNVREVTANSCWYAFVGGEGYAFPYWDSTVGPYIETENGPIGQGEVRIRVAGVNDVFWEPGQRFEDTRWYALQYAMPIDQIEAEPGYIGPKSLRPDASFANVGRAPRENISNLCVVTEYFQRPSPEEPDGLKCVIANKSLLFDAEPFPIRSGDGKIVDEPPAVRLGYSSDPSSDRDSGFVAGLIDAQRTLNDVSNRALEWKNLALAPQLMAPEGSLLNRPTSTPGDVVEYRTIPGMPPPTWRETPPIPRELAELKADAERDMAKIANSGDLPPAEIESGKEAVALLEAQEISWSNFLLALGEFHSGLMQRCLTLVQRHYSEPRLMKYRGWMGWESLEDFRGADLRGQTDVRVLPGSLEPQSRRALTQTVMNWAQLGWVTPQAAMQAITTGTDHGLIEQHQRSVRQAQRVILQIRRDPEGLLNSPQRPVFPGEEYVDFETGQLLTHVPSWLPKPFDNVPVLKETFEGWLSSPDYDRLSPVQVEVAHLYYGALIDLENQALAKAAIQQEQQAEQMGMQNAAKAQGGEGVGPSQAPPPGQGGGSPKSLPSLPKIEN